MDGWTLESRKIEDRTVGRPPWPTPRDWPSISEVKRRREHAKPPDPDSTWTMISEGRVQSDRHGLTAEQTLDCSQHLYEMKVATYPRTRFQYVTHDDVDG